MQNLAVGLVADAGLPGWRRLVEQEGLAFSVDDPRARPVVLFSGTGPAWLEDYVAAGGVAVGAGLLGEPFGLACDGAASVTGFASPVDGRWVQAPGLARLYRGEGAGVVRMHENRVVKYGIEADVYPAVQCRRIGKGVLVFTGIALTELVAAKGDTLRRFSELTEVTERVATVDKARLLDVALFMVRRAFFEAALPLVRRPRFPHGAPSALLLRIDVDGAFGGNTSRIADAADQLDLPVSFFVNEDLCEQSPGLPETWPASAEIGQHGGLHTLLDSVEDNRQNLRRAQHWLEEKTDRARRIFVAPRGMWNASLAQALVEEGFDWSSDFGLDFDSLPFRADHGILQLPVHPYSTERAWRWSSDAGVPPPTAEATAAYFRQVADEQVRLGRPVHLYSHPEHFGEMAEVVLGSLKDYSLEHAVPVLRISEYAEFWRRREEARPRVAFDAGRDLVEVDVAEVGVESRNPVDVRADGHAHRVPGAAFARELYVPSSFHRSDLDWP